MGEFRSFTFGPSTRIYARPFAPNSFTKSVYLSICPLPKSFALGITKAAILLSSEFAGSEKTLNSSF